MNNAMLIYARGIKRPTLLIFSLRVVAAMALAVAAAFIGFRVHQYTHLHALWDTCAAFKPAFTPAYCELPAHVMPPKNLESYTKVANAFTTSYTAPTPSCWIDLQKSVFSQNSGSPLLYLGERTSHTGKSRLVAVELPPNSQNFFTFSVMWCGIVLSKPSINSASLCYFRSGAEATHSSNFLPNNSLEIDFGHADINDSARFLIPYRLGDIAGLITGVLTNRDTLEFEISSGPGRGK